MSDSEPFVDGYDVCHSVTAVDYDTAGPSAGIQTQYGLHADIHGWYVKSLEHNFGHFLPVDFRIQGSFGQHYGMFVRVNT